MEKITNYFEQDSKDRDFGKGVQLLIENDKNIKPQQAKFLKEETKEDEPSKVAIQMLEARLRRLLRIGAQTSKKNEEENAEGIIKAPKKEKTEPKPENTENDKPENLDEPETETEDTAEEIQDPENQEEEELKAENMDEPEPPKKTPPKTKGKKTNK